jgi:competence protein ComEA
MKNLRHILAGTAVSLLLPLSAWAGPVNVNTADAETISAELQGVGLTKANAIVEYREEHGPFRSANDLAEVKGIGQRTIEINQGNILVQDGEKSPK